MRTWLTSLGIAAGALLVGATAATAVPTTDLQPEDLPRGADIAIPHIEGSDLVDGSRRVELGAPVVTLIGRSGSSFIVGTTARDGSRRSRILRVRPDDSVKVLVRGVEPWQFIVSQDGRHLVHAHARNDASTRVRVWSARSGAVKKDRSFRDYLDALDADAGRVILSGFDRGTFQWDISGGTTRLTRRHSGLADIRLDRLASYTGDPYLDGCMKVSTLSRPGRVLWTSCKERVEAFSPDGGRLATVHLLSDGLGPGDVWARELDGTKLAHYTTSWFGAVEWETATDLLLTTNGGTRSATVRCELEACENATDHQPVVMPRPVRAGTQNIRVDRRVVSTKPTRS